jgi:hypothetical protein
LAHELLALRSRTARRNPFPKLTCLGKEKLHARLKAQAKATRAVFNRSQHAVAKRFARQRYAKRGREGRSRLLEEVCELCG